MPIAAPTDFFGDIAIAQVEQNTVSTTVLQYIDKYEPEYLRYIMGEQLYAAYLLAPNTQEYIDIRDGVVYVGLDGLNYNWQGLKRGILLYVYYHYLRDTTTFTTGSGQKTVAYGNSESSVPKQIRAWNEMVVINNSFYNYLITLPTQINLFDGMREIYTGKNSFGL